MENQKKKIKNKKRKSKIENQKKKIKNEWLNKIFLRIF
jgi:hypothetical protein